MLGQSITKNGLLLGLFAVVTTGVIAGTYLSTRGLVQDNIRAAEERALLEIIPRDRHDNSMLDDAVALGDDALLGLREPRNAYRAKQNGEVVAVILPATARDGYTGDIDLIIGVNRDGSVAGVRVLSHRETPGLGDQIDYKKSQWVDGFIGRSLLNPKAEKWTVKKDGGVFDQFTGATITPRAVTAAVKRSLEFYAQQRPMLLDEVKQEKGDE
ncbi:MULTISPECIES: electron transport complex subunit RsxG [Spongiibacter]|jgi:electron transport complex protein RnfG|uniref:electron transport complex subunit RsxG n=1 Tax=Spongiibacter TaxID=630749 RepID=UPI00257F49BE|nr:electron transport complex subunit RsxG [Spongiibacter sp. UBA1325]|tara:strand:+ start:28452 stop:29090 length:639 start_codon:yes stop_codon:yes gene_type:complete